MDVFVRVCVHVCALEKKNNSLSSLGIWMGLRIKLT